MGGKKKHYVSLHAKMEEERVVMLLSFHFNSKASDNYESYVYSYRPLNFE